MDKSIVPPFLTPGVYTCCRCSCSCWDDLFKKAKANSSFQIGSGWNLAGLFLD